MFSVFSAVFLGLLLQATINISAIIVLIGSIGLTMNYTHFRNQAIKIKNMPLPGHEAHFKMAPEFRIKELKQEEIQKRNPRFAGVMALFYPKKTDDSTQLLLILRKTYKGVHSNQIGFPGGKREKTDTSILETALRETEEEVGVATSDIEVIKELSEVFIPPSNFLVQPYIGFYPQPKPFVIQESEVEQLVEVSLQDFLNEENIKIDIIDTSYAKNVEVPIFSLNGHTVWGATAMMLNEIKSLLIPVL